MSNRTARAVALIALAVAPVVACTVDDTGERTDDATGAASSRQLRDGETLTDAQLLRLAPIGNGERAAAIVFPSGIENPPVVHGHIVRGGKVTVVFALDRLPSCRASHNGYGAWDTRVGGHFADGTLIGERLGADGRGGTLGRLVSFDNGRGGASARGHVEPFTFEVPDGADGGDRGAASSFEIYVHNTSPPGPSPECHTWDSAYGLNYRFDVEP